MFTLFMSLEGVFSLLAALVRKRDGVYEGRWRECREVRVHHAEIEHLLADFVLDTVL